MKIMIKTTKLIYSFQEKNNLKIIKRIYKEIIYIDFEVKLVKMHNVWMWLSV